MSIIIFLNTFLRDTADKLSGEKTQTNPLRIITTTIIITTTTTIIIITMFYVQNLQLIFTSPQWRKCLITPLHMLPKNPKLHMHISSHILKMFIWLWGLHNQLAVFNPAPVTWFLLERPSQNMAFVPCFYCLKSTHPLIMHLHYLSSSL